jgi:hypothetical protein
MFNSLHSNIILSHLFQKTDPTFTKHTKPSIFLPLACLANHSTPRHWLQTCRLLLHRPRVEASYHRKLSISCTRQAEDLFGNAFFTWQNVSDEGFIQRENCVCCWDTAFASFCVCLQWEIACDAKNNNNKQTNKQKTHTQTHRKRKKIVCCVYYAVRWCVCQWKEAAVSVKPTDTLLGLLLQYYCMLRIQCCFSGRQVRGILFRESPLCTARLELHVPALCGHQ